MRSNVKIQPGQRYGHLIVLEITPDKRWRCRCDCGNEMMAYTTRLLSGYTTHCGCQRYADLAGQRFGKLTALRRDEGKKPTHWICQCDCGKIVSVSVSNIHRAKSCGCEKLESAKKSMRINGNNSPLSNTRIQGTMLYSYINPYWSEKSECGVQGVRLIKRGKDAGQWSIHFGMNNKILVCTALLTIQDKPGVRKILEQLDKEDKEKENGEQEK